MIVPSTNKFIMNHVMKVARAERIIMCVTCLIVGVKESVIVGIR